MALFPCDIGAHRYQGKQQTIYPALVQGGSSERRKLRLCPAHLQQYLSSVSGQLHNAYDDSAPTTCMFGEGDEVAAQIFLTVYETGLERQDLFGSACEAHLPQVREALKLSL